MKKIHRFLLQQPLTDQVSITDPDLIHLMKTVLKLAEGEECIVFTNGSDDLLCEITTIEKKEIILSKKQLIPKKIIPKTITACISIVKRDNVELIVQKLTELGVATIIPIISERTVKQALRIDRLQKISDEALEQSGGSTRVHITEPLLLRDALEQQKNTVQCYFDMDGAALTSTQEQDITFYIGPEGGWSDGDKILLQEHSLKAYTLAGTVLRAETAAIVAAHTLLWQ